MIGVIQAARITAGLGTPQRSRLLILYVKFSWASLDPFAKSPLVSASFLPSSAGPGSCLPISSSFTVRAFAVSSAVSALAISPGPVSSSGIPVSEHERHPRSSRSIPAPAPARSVPRRCLWTSSGRARSLPSRSSATENCHSLPVLSAPEDPLLWIRYVRRWSMQ
jgi:hypothetical protein